MGAFFLVRREPGHNPEATLERAERSFSRQGFAPPRRFRTASCDILVYPKQCGGTENWHLEPDRNLICATGTLLYRQHRGAGALALLARDLRGAGIDWRAVYGQFGVVAAYGDEVRIFNDAMGLYHVWHDEALRVVSSSFLAILETRANARLDPQSAYEYVFQESTYGGASLVDGIRQLDCASEIAIGPGAALRPIGPRPGLQASASSPVADHLGKSCANLASYFTAIARCFGDRIDTALSGGYDSRLIVACLRAQRIAPRIHVYGREGDVDVVVAKRIADGEGLALEHTDKSDIPPIAIEDFASFVSANMDGFDGTPADGVFDNGTDLATRRERGAGGTLMLNGGGGEVFRNFFYLPDRPITVRALLWSFYSQFDPRAMRAPFDETTYFDAMARKLMAALDVAGEVLPRIDVERAYPGFRCRYWMGRNNSVNNRLGYALTPFIDANVVPDALAIPIARKNSGRFEAELIAAIDPRLAAYPSAYGHDFAHPPPRKRVLMDTLNRVKPPLLRRYSFRLQWRAPAQRPYFLSDAYVRKLIEPGFPILSRLFDVRHIYENGQYNRLCTLELLCQRFGLSVP